MANPVIAALLGSKAVAFSPVLAKAVGINEALFLQQIMYWSERTKSEWVWHTADQIEAETCLTRRQQELARAKLVNKGVLKSKLDGMPARLHYKVEMENLESLLVDLVSTKGENKVHPNSETYESTGGENTTNVDVPADVENNGETPPTLKPWDVWVWWCDQAGIPAGKMPKDVGGMAKTLIESYAITTTADLDALRAWMLADPWFRERGLDFPLMLMAVKRWRTHQGSATSDVRSPGQGLWDRHGGRI